MNLVAWTMPMPFSTKTNTALIVEDDDVALMVIQEMSRAGVPFVKEPPVRKEPH